MIHGNGIFIYLQIMVDGYGKIVNLSYIDPMGLDLKKRFVICASQQICSHGPVETRMCLH